MANANDFFATKALMPNGELKETHLEDYHGSYALLLFYIFRVNNQNKMYRYFSNENHNTEIYEGNIFQSVIISSLGYVILLTN